MASTKHNRGLLCEDGPGVTEWILWQPIALSQQYLTAPSPNRCEHGSSLTPGLC
jgi:hypothetical protein